MQEMVLGISLNSRLVGLAAIKDRLLHDCKVLFFEERWSKEKASRMLQAIIQFVKEHSPNCMAVVLPHEHHKRKETAYLLNRVKLKLSKEGIIFTPCKADALHIFCNDAKAKKKALMSEMVLRYPELQTFHRKELQNKKIHYHKLFEAVAAATIVVDRNNNSK